MGFLERMLLAVGLSMDAFAVSVCKGLALKRPGWKQACLVGAWFGAFQALMPLLGYLLGSAFEGYITAIDHWVAFALLALIGGNMLREALCPSAQQTPQDASLRAGTMLMLAIATSIDALAVGITFAFLQVHLLRAVLLIGATTFVISLCGVRLGGVFGQKYERRAQIAGGVILILLGTKILLEHLNLLPF